MEAGAPGSAAAGADTAASAAGPRACDHCGSCDSSESALGLQVCGACGNVLSFSRELKAQQSFVEFKEFPGRRSLLRVEASHQQWAHSKALVKRDEKNNRRVRRCRMAIASLISAVRLQKSVEEPALQLLVRHCERTSGVPTLGPRLKKLVSACVLAASTRQGLGLTINEVAARANLDVNEVKRTVWRVCKVGGVRLQRSEANAQALFHRLCDRLPLRSQRGAVCEAAGRILAISCRGWLSTGRMFAGLAGAAFVLAAKSYHFVVEAESIARMLCVGEGSVTLRMREMRELLVSMFQNLPWGGVVNAANVHLYLHFAVDFFDILVNVNPILRRRPKLPSPAVAAKRKPRKPPATTASS